MGQFEDLFLKALAAAERGESTEVLAMSSAKTLGSHSSGIAGYLPFHKLSSNDQSNARGMYPYKSTGGKYDFKDEHFFYPVDKHGRLYHGRGGQRVLAFSHKSIVSGEIEKFGYKENVGWDIQLPRYTPKSGWKGGDTKRLYAFVDKYTHQIIVRPGGKNVGIGPEVKVRPATRAEAEKHWQSPLHDGWKVL